MSGNTDVTRELRRKVRLGFGENRRASMQRRLCGAVVVALLAETLMARTVAAQCEAVYVNPVDGANLELELDAQGHGAPFTFEWIDSGCRETNRVTLFKDEFPILFSVCSAPIPVSGGPALVTWDLGFNPHPTPEAYCWRVTDAPDNACFTVTTVGGPTPTPTPNPEPGGFPPLFPPTPREATDTRYVVTSGPGINTACHYNTDGPIDIQIPIDRYVGPVDSFGTLQDVGLLVGNGILSPDIELTIEAWDVDTGGGNSSVAPEINKVTFNGVPAANATGAGASTLNGSNGTWSETKFKIPIGVARFRERGTNGQPPPDNPLQTNLLRIEVDTGNSFKMWCTSIAAVTLSFKAMSPVILVHGNGSEPAFWTRQGFEAGLEDLGVALDNTVELPEASISTNSLALAFMLEDRAREFGVDHLHLVAHSKGGLDSRDFLAMYSGAFDFEVVSLVTLSTPHRGSGLADFAVSYQRFGAVTGATSEAMMLATFASLVGSSALSVTEGRRDLTVGEVGRFNERNISKLPTDTIIQVIGADSNTDDDPLGQLSFSGDNLNAFLLESPGLQVYFVLRGPPGIENMFSILYRFLLNRRVSVAIDRTLSQPAEFVPTTTSNEGGGPNDVMVTIFSAEGPPNSGFELQPNYLGGDGRNHADIGDGRVASDAAAPRDVFRLLIETDTRNGGLK